METVPSLSPSIASKFSDTRGIAFASSLSSVPSLSLSAAFLASVDLGYLSGISVKYARASVQFLRFSADSPARNSARRLGWPR